MQRKIVTTFYLIVALSVSIATPHSFAATYSTPADDSLPELHIDRSGNFMAHQLKVMQIAGTSFYARYYVGLAFLRILIKTDTNTKVFRKFGDEVLLDQIVVGDVLNVEGQIESGADSLSIVANKISDLSNQKEISNFQGTIGGTGSTTGSFLLITKNGPVTINTGASTQIRKGSRIISTDLVKNGDIVTDVVGTYDHATKVIDATVVTIYIDKNIFTARNFEGTLKSVSSSNTLVLSTENKDYTVVLSSGAPILNKSRKTVSIKRYLEGDTVRVYGAIREAEDPIIDAQIVRNTSLQ